MGETSRSSAPSGKRNVTGTAEVPNPTLSDRKKFRHSNERGTHGDAPTPYALQRGDERVKILDHCRGPGRPQRVRLVISPGDPDPGRAGGLRHGDIEHRIAHDHRVGRLDAGRA